MNGSSGSTGEGGMERERCTDIYFHRSVEVLMKEGINPVVTAEISATALTDEWAVFCGLDDVITLLEGRPVSMDAVPEGTVFYPGEPVMRISGRYCDFAALETSILGYLCHASGIATAAAWIRHSSGDRPVYSFGSRRQHPAISTMIERAAWIGGVDGVSNTCAPEGIPLVGTMPHAFVMCHGDAAAAWRAFNRYAPADVPRVMLCDTFSDEKEESLRAAEIGCEAVRLDTPKSRRGDMRSILEEVRWELDARGHRDVKIFLSGGLTREEIIAYQDIADAFGVGGAIANAPVIDFSMDLVEIDGEMCAKRGKRCGVKEVYSCGPGKHLVLPAHEPPPPVAVNLMEKFVDGGTVLRRSPYGEARGRVQEHLLTPG